MNETSKIRLTNGELTIVDSDDFPNLSQFSWNKHNLGYAFRRIRVNGKRRTFWLHRLVNHTPEGFETDHINHDRLDNRKANLRTATSSQNKANTVRPKTTSRFRGVVRSGKKWMAIIGGERNYLGVFSSEESAAVAYNMAAQVKYGEFAILNKVQQAT